MENVHESRVLIACCQIEPRIGDKEGNLKKTLEFAEKAATEGADIIVLPELANTGYVFSTRGESLDLSEEVPGGDSVRLWEEFSKSNGVYLAAGIAERADDRLYNSSVLIGPGGYIGKYRKLHLWNREKLFFEPGNLGLPVFHTPLGRLAMYICYDMWFPEMTRAYALMGVDLILNPTNWVTPDLERETGRLTEAVCSSQAHLNSVFIAAADRIGTERGQPFMGSSMIASPSGKVIGGPASLDREEIVCAECDLMDARASKRKTRFNNVLSDRRTDVYDIVLGKEKITPFY